MYSESLRSNEITTKYVCYFSANGFAAFRSVGASLWIIIRLPQQTIILGNRARASITTDGN